MLCYNVEMSVFFYNDSAISKKYSDLGFSLKKRAVRLARKTQPVHVSVRGEFIGPHSSATSSSEIAPQENRNCGANLAEKFSATGACRRVNVVAEAAVVFAVVNIVAVAVLVVVIILAARVGLVVVVVAAHDVLLAVVVVADVPAGLSSLFLRLTLVLWLLWLLGT